MTKQPKPMLEEMFEERDRRTASRVLICSKIFKEGGKSSSSQRF